MPFLNDPGGGRRTSPTGIDPPMSGFRPSRWFLAALLLVAASRLVAIPGVPWEQDEALFATAAFKIDLAAHHPHPPGFPLWVGVGKIGAAVLGDPVLALQLVSAVASVATVAWLATLWAAGLGRRELGEAAALLYAFLPATWFHAPRAFSTTPALALAVAGCVVMLKPGRRTLAGGAALLGAAVLVRPVLAPPFAFAALAATALRRDAALDRLLAVVAGLAVVVVGFLPMIFVTGGLGPFLAALGEHGATHAGALHLGSWRPVRLGIVRAVAGLVPAVAGSGACILGWVGWRRRRPRVAGWWLAVTVVSLAWLLLAHNRTYTRYTLPVLALAVGPIVAGLSRLLGAPRRAVWAATAAVAVAASWTAPAIWVQATEPFPPLSALASADADPYARAIVVDGALSPFTDLGALADRGRLPAYWRPLLAAGRIPPHRLPGPWVFVGSSGTPLGWLAPAWPPPEHFAVRSARLAALAQDRFLDAFVCRGGALVLDPMWPALGSDGSLPLGPPTRLLLEPAPAGSMVVAEVVATGSVIVRLEPDGGSALGVAIEPGTRRLEVSTAGDPHRPPLLRVSADGPTGAARLLRVWVERPDRSPAPAILTPAMQAEGLGGLVVGTGFYGVEPALSLPGGGRWTGSRARLSTPAAASAIEVDLAAPRPTPARVRLACPEAGLAFELEVGPSVETVRLPLPRPMPRTHLELVVDNPFVPADTVAGSRDRRLLGVVVGEVRRIGTPAAP